MFNLNIAYSSPNIRHAMPKEHLTRATLFLTEVSGEGFEMETLPHVRVWPPALFLFAAFEVLFWLGCVYSMCILVQSRSHRVIFFNLHILLGVAGINFIYFLKYFETSFRSSFLHFYHCHPHSQSAALQFYEMYD